VTRYGRWLLQTQTLVVLVGFLAPFRVERKHRPEVWLASAMIAATAAIYFAYTPFDDWSYLRFLLPAIALLIALTSAVVARAAAAFIGPRASVIFVTLLTCSLAISSVGVARDRLAFQMHSLEQRYRSAAIVVRDRLPAGAAILTTWDSGAIRFHAGNEAIVWDALDPAWLDRSIAWLTAQGHAPFILVESWEEAGFRDRFAAQSDIGKLDWPPKFEVDRVVRIYDPADRARYLKGERLVTEYLWPLRK
jgi:hypothetical protein